SIVGGRQGGGRGRRCVVACPCRRRPRPEVLVLCEGLGDQLRSHHFPVRSHQEASVGLEGEQELPGGEQRRRIDNAADAYCKPQEQKTLCQIARHIRSLL